jgi:hypothetical protein
MTFDRLTLTELMTTLRSLKEYEFRLTLAQFNDRMNEQESKDLERIESIKNKIRNTRV